MAASKDFGTPVVKSSDETFDTCCSPCNEAGTTKEAKTFCVDCESYFCEDCLSHHNKFTALRSHQIVDKSEKERSKQKEAETCLPTERCAKHNGKLIDMYCGNHDKVCCAACVAIKHGACVNIDYLPDIAKGILDSAELKGTLVSMKDVLIEIKQEREKTVGNFACLDQEKENLFKNVDEDKRVLIQKIKELAENSKQQISEKQDKYRKFIQADVDKLDTVISTMATSVQKFSSKNEAQLFVHMKSGNKSVQDCKTMLREMSSKNTKKELQFRPNERLMEILTTLGSIFAADEDIREYEATLYGKFKVAPTQCQVTGACVIEDGTFLVSDFMNRKLKRLNRNFTVKDQIEFYSSPCSLQTVGPAEVAVFCESDQVNIVSVRDVMKLTASFYTSESASGGSYNFIQDEMFLLTARKMCICMKNGNIVKTYENNDITQNKWSKQTALSRDNNKIYFGNYSKGLLALNREGKTLWSFKDPVLTNAWGVCVLPGDIILVCDVDSNNILQVDKYGRKIGILLGPSEKMSKPTALAFDRRSSKLLVGYKSNEINIYTLQSVNE